MIPGELGGREAAPLAGLDNEPAAGTPPDYGAWSRRYLEHAPFAIAVVHGASYALVHANAAFRRLAGTPPPTAGRPIVEGFDAPTARALEALLDRVRRNGTVVRDAVLSTVRTADEPWRFTVWPVAGRSGRAEQLVILLVAGESNQGVTRASQTEIAERLLLTALREQMLAEEAEASRQRSAFLSAASVRVGASLDAETTYASIAGLSLPRPGTWCVVDIIEPDGTLRRLAIVHPDRAKQELVRGLEHVWLPAPGDTFGVPVMLRSPQPLEITDDIDVALATNAHGPDTLRALRELGIGPLLVVPIIIRETVVGAITFVSRPDDAPYLPEEVSLAQDLAAACAAAIESARLYDAANAARAAAEAAQREAEAANRAKSRFLSMMTHDLRTPLNAIGGYAQLIDEGVRGPVTDDQHHDLRRIKASQEHLLGLINKILSFAKLEAGRVEYEMASLPLATFIRDVQSFIGPQLVAKRLEYRFQPPPDPMAAHARVHADPEKLVQVLVNLLTNAIKFTEAGGRITVSYQVLDEDRVAVHVHDTGRGIAPDEIEAVFEPFVQAGSGRLPTGDGVGLGLAICRELARGMGGDLTAESTVGVGSVFTLVLRRSAPA